MNRNVIGVGNQKTSLSFYDSSTKPKDTEVENLNNIKKVDKRGKWKVLYPRSKINIHYFQMSGNIFKAYPLKAHNEKKIRNCSNHILQF